MNLHKVFKVTDFLKPYSTLLASVWFPSSMNVYNLRKLLRDNPAPQCWHFYSFSPRWVCIYSLSNEFFVKTLIHVLCIGMASPQYECAHVCSSKYCLKTLFHTPDIGMVLPSMSALMPGKVPTPWQICSTLLTCEWLLHSMSKHMCFEVTAMWKEEFSCVSVYPA